jgi:anti-sigma factor RsiW
VKDIERMVVSAHEDGEVEAPWKDQVSRRIAEDPAWAAEADRHRRVKAALAASPEPDFSAARERILARIQAGVPSRPEVRSFPVAWVSVAAAALLVAAVGSGYWLGRISLPAAPAQTSAAEVSELQVQVPHPQGLKLSGEGQLLMASTLQGSGR